jgi:hypothetical protein
MTGSVFQESGGSGVAEGVAEGVASGADSVGRTVGVLAF